MKGTTIAVTGACRRAGQAAARAVPVVAATAAAAMVAAACAAGGSLPGSGTANAAGPASSPSAVAYAQCMRSHGLPSYPDPDSNGVLPKTSAQQLGVSSSQYQTAENSCQHLLASTGESFQQQAQQCSLTGDCPAALVQQMLTAGRRFATCMRAHGVPNWPDPTLDDQGRPYFPVSSHGFTHAETHSAQMQAKAGECERLSGNAPVPMG